MHVGPAPEPLDGEPRARTRVQAFYFANRFHDHLRAAPIGFTDGASRAPTGSCCRPTTAPTTGPDRGTVNNANMFTPPDGTLAA